MTRVASVLEETATRQGRSVATETFVLVACGIKFEAEGLSFFSVSALFFHKSRAIRVYVLSEQRKKMISGGEGEGDHFSRRIVFASTIFSGLFMGTETS